MTVISGELKTRVRERLARCPAWAVYALGDLAPGHFERCRWFLPDADRAAVALLYHGFSTPILWAAGPPESFVSCLQDLFTSRALILQLRPEWLPLVADHYALKRQKPMLRMALQPERFRPEAAAGAVRLLPQHLPALEELYLDGEAAGEGPEFFFPSMLEEGVFFGLWQDGRLAAVSGTHIYSPAEHAAAIGNVYTRREARGQGLAGRLTSAVVCELHGQHISVVALSVAAGNLAALRVYERLGFTVDCPFIEGLAERP